MLTAITPERSPVVRLTYFCRKINYHSCTGPNSAGRRLFEVAAGYRQCKAGRGIPPMPASSCGSFPTGSQSSPGGVDLFEKMSKWRKPPVALDDNRQRLRGEAAEFRQQREYLRRHVVQMVVEQTT